VKPAALGTAVACLSILAGACTVEDDQLLAAVGVTRLLLIDTALSRQSVANPDGTLQVAEWTVSSATLDISGIPVDLVPGTPCAFVDTALVAPGASGSCSEGVIIQALPDQPVGLTLHVSSMRVRRARPPAGPDDVRADTDEDGVANADDECPYLANETDANGDGLIDCFRFDLFGLVVADSDGDGVADGTDNCVWVAGPQTDTEGTSAIGIPDGIGDACTEEAADVEIDSGTEFDLHFEVGPTLTQPVSAITFLVVDFREALTSADCTWESGVCQLNQDAVQFCPRETALGALAGCSS
jgi:hypothetical protein